MEAQGSFVVSVYVVTGKLGQGKTLLMVDLMNEALADGLRVATNIDIDATRIPLINRDNRSMRLYRVPDKPTADDIGQLGTGSHVATYDEAKFGKLVLDECGTWLNSREWNESGRRELLDLLLHIRKRHWHVYLIIQDISMLDKQMRKALAEHVVYVRRLDNVRIPVINSITKFLFDVETKLPKMHVGNVRLGDQPNSLVVDRWQFQGERCYRMYDTQQVFRDDYPHGTFSVLPPGYIPEVGKAVRNLDFYMRLTKIKLRQYSLISIGALTLTIGLLLGMLIFGGSEGPPEIPAPHLADILKSEPRPKRADYRDLEITRSTSLKSGRGEVIEHEYRLDGVKVTPRYLALSGIEVTPVGFCVAEVQEGSLSYLVRC